MSRTYVAGSWAKKYRRLADADRQLVNQLTNQLFQQKTNVFRKLDPSRDRALCDEWLRLRDHVMEQRERGGNTKGWYSDLPFGDTIADGLHRGLTAATNKVESYVQEITTPWVEVAKQELRRGVAIKPGKPAHTRIMMYSRTCPHLYSTINKQKYMRRNGDEGFKWCSAFVNWCLKEVGIVGTRNARALSWLNWGKPISKPQHGAIVVLKTKSWNHVAFVTMKTSGLKMLGGNQKPEKGSGTHCVSYQRIIPSQVVGYRMPN